MTSTSRGAHKLASFIRPSHSPQSVCSTCLRTLRRQASTAAAPLSSPSHDSTSSTTEPTPSPLPTSQPTYKVRAAAVLSRAPIITPTLHPFESAYHLYQRRLNERLVLPFTQYFYYKKGTPSFEHFRNNRRKRGGVAGRDIGDYNAYTKESWNDEVLVGSKESEERETVRRLVAEDGRAAEISGESGKDEMGGLVRRTRADERGDTRSLERRLERTLYLMVKRREVAEDEDTKGGEMSLWGFPTAEVEGREGLKETAQRVLTSSCGPNMNTWFIGNHPVGHMIRHADFHTRNDTEEHSPTATTTPADTEASTDFDPEPSSSLGEKTFFMKARIFAGQADVSKGVMGEGEGEEIEDFKWLSKDEIKEVVVPGYWVRIKNMLADQ